MAIMEISVVPIGTDSPSVSTYIAATLFELKREKGVTYKLTPMATIIEAKTIGKLFRIAEKMHKCIIEQGAERDITMKSKIESVEKKI